MNSGEGSNRPDRSSRRPERQDRPRRQNFRRRGGVGGGRRGGSRSARPASGDEGANNKEGKQERKVGNDTVSSEISSDKVEAKSQVALTSEPDSVGASDGNLLDSKKPSSVSVDRPSEASFK